MWGRSDFEDGYQPNKTGSTSDGSPRLVAGHDSTWHSISPGHVTILCGGRRHSTVSDSGDTGIGTYCSDSVEDDSSSSTTPLSFQPLTQLYPGRDDVSPVAPAISSPSYSPYTSFKEPASPSSTVSWSRSCQLLSTATSPEGTQAFLDMKHCQPMRRCSSLTKLSSGSDEFTMRTGCQYNPDSLGSLDRGLLYGNRQKPLVSNTDLYVPLSSSLLYNSLLQRSPGAGPSYRYSHSGRCNGLETDPSISSTLSSPAKQNNLDMNYSPLPEAKLAQAVGQVHGLSLPQQLDSVLGSQADRTSSTSVRTQMWLAEQMEYRPKVMHGGQLDQANTCAATESSSSEGLSPWKQRQQQEPGMRKTALGSSLPVNTLVKVKEGLLRQRELEIDRQKQQILHLQSRIRENELRAHQVLQSRKGWFDSPRNLNSQESTMRMRFDGEHGRKLAVAELKVLHLNEFYKQVTKKYTEDIRKLEEKIRTRDRYISSLKKKCKRENELNQEKQQRIEILEKYLSDLPTLEEVQTQSEQQKEVRTKAEDLQRTMSRLQKSLEEACAVTKEKNTRIDLQAKRENELIANVLSLQKKVQQCLDDGVRMPMQDLKQLEVEHTQLLEQKDHNSRLIEHQKEECEKLSVQLKAATMRLQNKRDLLHQQQPFPLLMEGGPASTNSDLPQEQQVEEGLAMQTLPCVEVTEVARLLKEMSLCLLDLQALCSILAQRAQGKDPNLSLLLGMKSLSVSEETDCRLVVEEELKFKLLEVRQMRSDIDELWKTISNYYDQCMAGTCVSQ